MPKIDIQLDSNIIGHVSLDPQEIWSQGGPDFPTLNVRMEISLSPYQQYGQPGTVKPVLCISIAGELCSPPERCVARFQHAECLYSPAESMRTSTSQIIVVVPLSLRTLDRIEQSRNGNLQASLKLKPLLALHSSTGGPVDTLRYASVSELRFTIPKSEWVEKILPGLGYKGLELVEFDTGPASSRELAQSIEEVKQARQELFNRDWPKAAHRCRNAIELIVASRPNTMGPSAKFSDRVNAFVHDHLKASPEQAKLITKQMNLLWEACSPSAHPLPVVERADAEFLVRTTISVIGYCEKLLQKSSSPIVI